MQHVIASTPISKNVTQTISYLMDLVNENSISILSLHCVSGALKIVFLVNLDGEASQLGIRCFNDNTVFHDAEDLLNELWMTNELTALSIT